MADTSKPTTERSVVRSKGRAARQALNGTDRADAEAALVGHLKSLDAVSNAATVGVFIAHDGEPDLMPLIEWLWAREAVVALPVLKDDPTDSSMRFVPWSSDQLLHDGRYGIPVPPHADSVELDTVLVSFTGFDAMGNRIGRGAGFFDRYLATCSARVIGVGFEAQRFALVPTDEHDVTLPMVVTDLGVRFLS